MNKRKKRQSNLNSIQNKIKIGPIDLTKSETKEPEIIVLDNSEVEFVNFFKEDNESCKPNFIDLTSPREESLDISVIKIIEKCPKSSTTKRLSTITIPDDEIKVLGSNFKLKKVRKNHNTVGLFDSRNGKNTSTAKISITGKVKHSADAQPGNISAGQPNSLPFSKVLSERPNILKYSEHLDKVSKKVVRKRNKKSPSVKGRLRKHKKREIKTKIQNKYKPQEVRQNNSYKMKQDIMRSNHSHTRSSSLRKIKVLGENNTINPMPIDLDSEGLRPIAIDGSNVAVQHGKGQFSTWGVKICVEFFHKRGHRTIKVFLPQHRKELFSCELLMDLNTKCDIVFTPTYECLDGRRKVPYDDRFIVQYATEFGGVIVSNDNFRDLARENPRWKDTIERRLLMFTWVDDYLMFPVDPLGRSGPTLDQYLRF